jgi:hypothetical protein
MEVWEIAQAMMVVKKKKKKKNYRQTCSGVFFSRNVGAKPGYQS